MENRKIKILAIDDNEDNLIILKALINESVFNVEIYTATNGKKGLALAAKEFPDVILLDIVMPEMSGFEVCEKLKADNILKEIPVVFITAIASDKAIRIRALEVGGEAFLTKPIDESELVAQIRAMVKIKEANIEKLDREKKLQLLVAEKTHELNEAHKATLNLLEDLKNEIEERKKVAEELIKSKKLLDETGNMAKVGGWEINLETETLIWTNEVYRIHEVADNFKPNIAEAIDFYTEQSKPIITKAVQHLIENNEPFDLELEIKTAKGNIKNVRAIGKKNELSNIFFGTFQDITERKKSAEEYKTILITTIDGFFLIDLNGKILDVNNSYCLMIGYSRNELLNMSIKDLEVTETDEQIKKRIRNIMNTGPVTFETKHKRKDGVLIDIDASCNFLKDEKKRLFVFMRDVTERKKQKIELHESKTHLQAILQSTADGILALDKDDNILYHNNQFEKIWNDNVDKKNFMLKNFLGMLNDPQKFQNKVTELYNTIKKFNGSISFKDGRIFEVYSCPMLTGGQINGRVWSFRDVTEKIHSENLIRESEARYRLVLNTMNEGLLTVDNDDVVQFVNERMLQITSYTRNELIGKVAYEIIVAKEYRDVIKQKNLQRIAKISDSYEVQFVKKNGEIIWVRISGSPIIDAEGKVIGSIGIHTDITERKKNESQLHQLSHAVEQSPVSIIITNLDGNIEYVNPMFTQTSGYTFDDVKGKNPHILQLGEKTKEEYENLWNTILSGKNWEGEFHNKKKNGELYWESALISPITNNQGVITNYLAIKTEITDQKLAEIFREKITNDLVQRNKDLEQFTYIVSHNLRAPIANIKGFNELLNTMVLNEKEKEELLNNIGTSVNKLDDVIQDLNTILQVNQQFNEKKETINFLDLLNDVKLSVGIKTDDKDIHIKTDFSQINEMFTLKSYLFSVFHNLISNSIKYRQPNIPCVIEIKNKLEKNKLSLIFTDNGLGIDLDKKGNLVFGLYKKFHANIEGKGIGLYMVKTQIESLGGTISIKSEVNKGTEFLIEFNL